MILSTKNSYDSRKTKDGSGIELPFTGIYEVVDHYSGIYIYIKTTYNDTLDIFFDNINYSNDEDKYVINESYNIYNQEKYIYIPTKLKYFKLSIDSDDAVDPNGVRIINTYYLSQLANTINYGVDASGFNHPILTDNSGHLIISSGSSSITTTFPKVNTDAFGRLRISNPFTLFDSKNVEIKDSKFTEYLVNSSMVNYDSNNSLLNLYATANGRVIRESKNVFAYQPGKSLLVLNTFIMSSGSSGLIQRVGYFDDNDGIYLEYNNTTLTLNIISTSNTKETKTYNVDWDYSIPGLDVTKSQIFWMDIEWLGVGSVRTGFVIDGQFVLCHTFHHANILENTYMKTAQLPVRYDISNNSIAPKILKQSCSSVISEGGYEGSSIIRHIGTPENTGSNGVSIVASNNTNYSVLVAIRLKSTRLKSIVIPAQIAILPQASCVYKVLLNPTLSGSVSWSSYDDNSAIEYTRSTGAVSITASGGTIVNSGYVASKETISLSNTKDFNLQLGRIFNGGSNTYTTDIIAVVLAGLGSGTTNAFGMIGWYEL
jgi:hypothetical protein